MVYQHVFGPVHSRRMGYSLGIDPVPKKACSMDCVYCEVSPTDKWTLQRREWVPADTILEEVERKLSEGHRIDIVTFSGSGEPLLHSRLGEMVNRIHEMADLRVCILTNGTHLNDPEVRAEVSGADVIAPSLDAVTPEVFQRINNPHPDLKVADVISGLKALRDEYEGEIWLEILFVAGFNDHDDEVRKLAAMAEELRPDRIHLSTIDRPPAYRDVKAVSLDRLEEIRKFFGEQAEVCAAPTAEVSKAVEVDLAALIEETASRRPITREDLISTIGRPGDEIETVVEGLLQAGRITERKHEGRVFLEVP
jgi:wyosine [tRNA(Phe)-imidazoG37] synthetase (radical SAM superfamily)